MNKSPAEMLRSAFLRQDQVLEDLKEARKQSPRIVQDILNRIISDTEGTLNYLGLLSGLMGKQEQKEERRKVPKTNPARLGSAKPAKRIRQ